MLIALVRSSLVQLQKLSLQLGTLFLVGCRLHEKSGNHAVKPLPQSLNTVNRICKKFVEILNDFTLFILEKIVVSLTRDSNYPKLDE